MCFPRPVSECERAVDPCITVDQVGVAIEFGRRVPPGPSGRGFRSEVLDVKAEDAFADHLNPGFGRSDAARVADLEIPSCLAGLQRGDRTGEQLGSSLLAGSYCEFWRRRVLRLRAPMGAHMPALQA